MLFSWYKGRIEQMFAKKNLDHKQMSSYFYLSLSQINSLRLEAKHLIFRGTNTKSNKWQDALEMYLLRAFLALQNLLASPTPASNPNQIPITYTLKEQ
jgi:hypothetical protein